MDSHPKDISDARVKRAMAFLESRDWSLRRDSDWVVLESGLNGSEVVGRSSVQEGPIIAIERARSAIERSEGQS